MYRLTILIRGIFAVGEIISRGIMFGGILSRGKLSGGRDYVQGDLVLEPSQSHFNWLSIKKNPVKPYRFFNVSDIVMFADSFLWEISETYKKNKCVGVLLNLSELTVI